MAFACVRWPTEPSSQLELESADPRRFLTSWEGAWVAFRSGIVTLLKGSYDQNARRMTLDVQKCQVQVQLILGGVTTVWEHAGWEDQKLAWRRHYRFDGKRFEIDAEVETMVFRREKRLELQVSLPLAPFFLFERLALMSSAN